MKLRKLLLMSPVVALVPFVSIIAISCNSNDEEQVTNYDLLPTYTGQADQLMALGIRPDYYPVQLDAPAPFSYITNPGSLMSMQEQGFKDRFAARLKALTPGAQGTSWWNQFALESGERGSQPEYWSHIGGTMVLYEHYLLDDGQKVVSAATAPKHFPTPQTFIETNFRNSRDPYTRLPKNIVEGLLDQPDYDSLTTAEKAVVGTLLDIARKVEGEHPTLKAVDGRPAPSGTAVNPIADGQDDESWLYNDFVFARYWHQNFLDSETFQKSNFAAWEVDASKGASNWVFDSDPVKNDLLYRIFAKSTYRASESGIKALVESKFAPLAPTVPVAGSALYETVRTNAHHPIYEQQEEVGSAPMFEGAMRDNLLYLFTLADRVQKSTTDTTGAGYNRLNATFSSDALRWDKMRTALDNANKIAKDMSERMAAIKVLVDRANNPTLGIVTLAPGFGESTVQTSSKFSFLYKEMGFKQPLPSEAELRSLINEPGVGTGGSLFNMDDNGWWWNLTHSNLDVSDTNVEKFGKQIDIGFLTANDNQFNNIKTADATSLAKLWKERAVGDTSSAQDFLASHKVDYNLWNEGLKAPFGLHMVLDQVLKAFNDKYRTQIITGGMSEADYDAQLAKASSWGDYFTKDFLA